MLIQNPHVSGQSLDLIEWHDSIKTGAIFAWKMTSVKLVNESYADFLTGLLIQMKYTSNPPTDPARIFNSTDAPNWVNIYINGFKIDLAQMGELGTAFVMFISPITYHYENGTTFHLDEMYRLANPVEGIDSYYTVENGYVNATMGNETTRYTTFTSIETGIAANVSIYMEEMGSLLLEYYAQAANVNDEGEDTSIEEDYTNFQDPQIMIRNIIIMSVGAVSGIIAVIGIYVIYRRSS
jgi:hypothetical protein